MEHLVEEACLVAALHQVSISIHARHGGTIVDVLPDEIIQADGDARAQFAGRRGTEGAARWAMGGHGHPVPGAQRKGEDRAMTGEIVEVTRIHLLEANPASDIYNAVALALTEATGAPEPWHVDHSYADCGRKRFALHERVTEYLILLEGLADNRDALLASARVWLLIGSFTLYVARWEGRFEDAGPERATPFYADPSEVQESARMGAHHLNAWATESDV